MFNALIVAKLTRLIGALMELKALALYAIALLVIYFVLTKMTELEILRAEYDRALYYPLFDNPARYCVLLDLITDRINQLTEENN